MWRQVKTLMLYLNHVSGMQFPVPSVILTGMKCSIGVQVLQSSCVYEDWLIYVKPPKDVKNG